MQLAGRTIREGSLEVDGINSGDYPDFCDAYFSYAEFDDGEKLTDEQLEELTDQYDDVVNMMAHDGFVSSAEDRYDYLRDR